MSNVQERFVRGLRAFGLVVAGLLLAPYRGTADEAADVAAMEARARRAGLRVLAGQHVILVTDRPPRAGDGVDDLPSCFDAAFASWCAHYRIDPETLAGWKACGCLVMDREPFRTAGLLPADRADFANGFCEGRRFWLADQANPAYRRHLFLHEGVHAFTISVRDLDAPQWYREGIAEYLATHRLTAGGDGRMQFVPTPVPAAAEHVEQLGRIESLQALAARGRLPTLPQVFAAPITAHDDITAYAANWAAVTLLARHPAHARVFARLERGPLDLQLDRRLAELPGWDGDRAARDYAAFVSEIDYGWDFERLAIDWSAGRPPAAVEAVAVAAGRGWQNTGLAPSRGSRCTISARGRVRVGEIHAAGGAATVLESSADGISLRWYRGRPVGRLLAAQWVGAAPAAAGRFTVIGEAAEAVCTAVVDGPLFLRINQAPADLADARGTLEVRITTP